MAEQKQIQNKIYLLCLRKPQTEENLYFAILLTLVSLVKTRLYYSHIDKAH